MPPEWVAATLARELRMVLASDQEVAWKYGYLRAVVAFAIQDLGGEDLWPEIRATHPKHDDESAHHGASKVMESINGTAG